MLDRCVTPDYEAVWSRAASYAAWNGNNLIFAPPDQIWFLILHMVSGPILAQILDIALMMKTSNVTLADMKAQMPATLDPVVKSEVQNNLALLQDLLNEEASDATLSDRTRKMLDFFFSDAVRPPLLFKYFNTLPSLRLRLLYIAGYFIPNPDYHPLWKDGKIVGCLRYFKDRRERL